VLDDPENGGNEPRHRAERGAATDVDKDKSNADHDKYQVGATDPGYEGRLLKFNSFRVRSCTEANPSITRWDTKEESDPKGVEGFLRECYLIIDELSTCA